MTRTDLRKPSFRRDLNELLFYRNGEVEHSKFWSNIGCGIVAYWLIVVPERVWDDWLASVMLASALIAPDVLRKVIALRQGDTSSLTVEKKTTVTQAEGKP